MLWKHKLTNHTQTLQWNTLCAYPCIIQEECTNRSRVWKYWHIWSRYGSRKDPFHFLILRNDFPLESLAPVTADTPLSMDDTMSLHSSVYLFPAEKKKQSVSFRSEIWNHSFFGSQCKMVLLHHACLSASMATLSFWLYCELSSSASVSPSHTHSTDNVLSS